MTTTIERMVMKPSSQDLRLRIVQAYGHREGSMRQLATRFAVSLSVVCDLITRHRATGNIAPKPHGGAILPNSGPPGLRWFGAWYRPSPRLP